MNQEKEQEEQRRFAVRYFAAGPVAFMTALWLSISATVVVAQDNWTAGSGNWSVAGNWSAGVPGSGAQADITDSDGVSRTVNYDYQGAPVTLGDLVIDLTGGTASATNTLSISGNVLTTSGGNVGYNGGSGTITQTGGSIIVADNGQIQIATGGASTGTYNLSGSGILTGEGSLLVGNAESGTGTFNQSGGSVNFTSGTSRELILGFAGSGNYYNLSAGSLTTGLEFIGAFGSGTFTQTSGTNTLTVGTGVTLEIGSDSVSGSLGTYVLSGAGILSANAEGIYKTGTFIQNGGTNSITAQSGGASLAINPGAPMN